MPRVNIYLPADLHQAVKDADLNVSAIAQAGLRAALGLPAEPAEREVRARHNALAFQAVARSGQQPTTTVPTVRDCPHPKDKHRRGASGLPICTVCQQVVR